MKRGLFRLWVVLSVCWAGGVGIIGFEQITDKLATTQYAYQRDADKGELLFEPSAKSGERAGMRFGDGTQLYFPPGEVSSNRLEEITNDQLDKILEAGEAFWAGRWWRYWQLSTHWLLAMFIPVIGMLVLGRAFMWVADGFRKPGGNG